MTEVVSPQDTSRRCRCSRTSTWRSSRRVAPLLALAMALAACGGGSTGGDTSATTAGAAPTEAASGVPSVLDFTAPQLASDGIDVVGADLAGTDVIVWFWAPW